ncbi:MULTISPECIES: hypothetical protein [unclassified Rhodococcus (in: high G+C Gram-positive bacteria)]|uniref:hypothetical protein n=1 Tax=unclassified Rhodococcus (in: high G+C Gram-positive bacteria) TaxID=192944 RepID=UPI00138685BC|nr:hypothetical protein [Rhodococcus sp. AH-ZY2]NCL73633.1 hypothetical protein [Rhodococcus sp. YH1]NCL78584.1 hypothetical protein [Rhodococcus sp. YH1]WML60870.1 hypothetical protein QNA09_00495 [Rhodococcus sp. AH-ZY2]
MTVTFTSPSLVATDAYHHSRAAAQNEAAATFAKGQLLDALNGSSDIQRILLKAAAGAGKSFLLRGLVRDAIDQPQCLRVAVTAFQNRQLWPLAASLGNDIGKDRVWLWASKRVFNDVPDWVKTSATVVDSVKAIPQDVPVVLTTTHMLGMTRQHIRSHFGTSFHDDYRFDVLFVDEAWQLPHHLFDKITYTAPIHVGVGDVGQLPPLEIAENPWRGDPGFNPYRAWPTAYDDDDTNTWATELPAVWRPTGEQLGLWRAFYPEWESLNCVAAPGDRSIGLGPLSGLTKTVWESVATGVPTLLEVDGLPDAEAADVDLPLIEFVESLLDELFSAGFTLFSQIYNDDGTPSGKTKEERPGADADDPLVAILATRNQAVDDAADAAARLSAKHNLIESDLIASTVDSWQGQTNGITIALHPLTGASELDEFNSAFGRLAVACTRATHGLLMVSRPGLDRLLQEAPVRPGTPFGEPGNRHLPRQTHQRILATFARGVATVSPTP